MVATEPPVSGDAIAVLKAIVAEVAGLGQPFSTDSYLPPHLVHDARKAIESAPDQVVSEAQSYSDLMLARLQKADQIIVALRYEVESLRSANDELASKVDVLKHTNGVLDCQLESARSTQRACDMPALSQISQKPIDTRPVPCVSPAEFPGLATAYSRMECDA